MRALLLASASLLLVGGTALAQTSMNTHADVAPRLVAAEATSNDYLMQAQQALHHGHTGAAREALERAETRALDRRVDASQAAMPNTDPKVAAIRTARDDLGRGDRAAAMKSIQAALVVPVGTAPMGTATSSMTSQPAPTPWTGPGRAPEVPPNTLGGIATSVGTPGGTGADNNANHPQASFSGPSPSNAVPPGSLGGISSSTGGDNGTGMSGQNTPQASFSGPSPSNAVPPGSLGGISSSTGGDNGTGLSGQNHPQASFSGPGTVPPVLPGVAAPTP